MSVIHTPRKPELDVRMMAFPGIMVAALLVLFMRLWYFQVVKAPELSERAEASRSIEVTQPAPRGLIYDRNGLLVAGVKPEFVITAMPSMVNKHPEVIDKVAAILNVDRHKLDIKLKEAKSRPDLFSPIYVGAQIKAGIQIAETRDELPGIGVELRPMRYYPDSKSFTHVLGYVWAPTADDIERIEKQNKKPADYVGRAGIERAFETTLMGEPGVEQRLIDAKRRAVGSMGGNAPNPGQQLVLTLDSRLQKNATQYMAEHKFVGGIVAIDPRSGEILCLVSSPTFDQNLFTGGISDTDWKQLTQNDEQSILDNPMLDHPMLDRAIRQIYNPGSTFKIVTSLAALEEGKFDPDMHFYCAGGVKVGNAFFKCLGYHGSIGYYDAMARSCNSFFYQLGRNVGRDALTKAALEFGLGQKEGLEIGGEAKGIVPTHEFMEMFNKDKWYTGDTLNFAIGQGYINATPLQLCNMIATVANNGTRYKPHLVKEIRSADGKGPVTTFAPETLNQIKASPEFWADLRKALQGVIQLPYGTGAGAKLPGTEWAGKTGSAEHGDKSGKTHAVFVGYAPAEDPKIAICVLIESKGHGGDIAAPVARDLVQSYLAEGKSSGLANSSASASAAAALTPSPKAR